MNKSALISGISGQDGSYLAQLLLSKGYTVWGTSRDAQTHSFYNLKKLGIFHRVNLVSMNPEDYADVSATLYKAMPDEVYFLAGQSSVGLSFEKPAETIQNIVMGILNMLEACRILDNNIRFFHACSSECFADTGEHAANEKTPFNPTSPYAVAKASAYWIVNNYRTTYNMFACNGILFNHESPLRANGFVTHKIIAAAKRIAHGSVETLTLGRIDILRDWGWAPEYVDAMWRMLQLENPEDFVIATGVSHLLEDFVRLTFSAYRLDWHDHVIQSDKFLRPSDAMVSRADPNKAKILLGWEAHVNLPQIIERMILES
jgi:GDPmannose 4,6-dehydratase